MGKKHKHTYDAQGRITCNTAECDIYIRAGAGDLIGRPQIKTKHQDEHSDDDGHNHGEGNGSTLKMFLPSIISLVLLLVAIYFDNFLKPEWFADWIRIVWYVVAYVPVGLPVLKEAVESIAKGEFFSEFLLMGARRHLMFPHAIHQGKRVYSSFHLLDSILAR
jgi:Cd2+/Zn2+-exporting ATPase